MGIRLLGPVEVWAGSAQLVMNGPTQRAVLAVLATEAGSLVPVDVLVDRVWGEGAPARARRTLHTYIARIRRITERLDGTGGQVTLVRRTGGYQLDIDPLRIDIHRFRALVERSRQPSCADQERL